MDWPNEKVLQFIELYKTNPCIWDPTHIGHKNKKRIVEAWIHIRDTLDGSCTVNELKRKKESLMAAYRAYKIKIKKTELTGELYQPTWFAFKAMDSFLGGVYKCNQNSNPENEPPQEEMDDSNNDTDPLKFEVYSDAPHPQTSHNGSHFAAPRHKIPRQIPEHFDQSMDPGIHYVDWANAQRKEYDNDDECDTFGRLVAKKLRRLSETRRDFLMMKINQLIHDDFYPQNS